MAKKPVITAKEAAAMIPDGATIMCGGFLACGQARAIVKELVARGTKDLTLIANDMARAVGPKGEEFFGIAELIHNHQVKRVIATHVGMTPEVGQQNTEGTLEVNLLPQGTLAECIRAGGAGLGGVLTPVGVDTLVEDSPFCLGRQTIDGKDYLIELDGYPFGAAPVKPTGERYALDADGLRLLAPVIPSKVYGLAKNYEAHAQFMHESGHSEIAHAPEDMVIFSKPSTSVIGPDDPIVIPSYSNDMNFEPEVAVIMGRIAKNVPVEKAMDYVLGFTCVNDVTLRDLQGLDPMWTRAKGFDTSCPLGPWIQTELDWKVSFTLNGEDVPMASGTTANLIHGIPEQIAAISSFSTLLPGDVIMTGTPNASGHLDPGDEPIVHVAGIGSLRNVVVRG